jgi:choice-of-anchor A domain-containing protein/MYXO-CTERM domain-containing protein
LFEFGPAVKYPRRLRFSVLFFLAACILFVVSQRASAGPLGDFNVLTFGDFSAPTSDVEGRLYAGGNVSLSSYSVGYTLSGAQVGGDTLVVGGDLSFTSGSVNNGNVKIGGSAAGVDSSVLNGLTNAGYTLTDNLGAGGLPVDFAAERTRLSAASAAFDGLLDTGTSVYQWSQLFLTGNGAGGRQVFTVSAADLGAATNVVVSGIDEGAEVIVNVTGTSASMSGGLDQFFERNNESVLFNFVDAETLSLGNIGVQGSILAVNADVTTSWGVVWGQVVADSWTGPMQVNDYPFEGEVPVNEEPGEEVTVAEPGQAAIVLLAVAGLAAVRRRRVRA